MPAHAPTAALLASGTGPPFWFCFLRVGAPAAWHLLRCLHCPHCRCLLPPSPGLPPPPSCRLNLTPPLYIPTLLFLHFLSPAAVRAGLKATWFLDRVNRFGARGGWALAFSIYVITFLLLPLFAAAPGFASMFRRFSVRCSAHCCARRLPPAEPARAAAWRQTRAAALAQRLRALPYRLRTAAGHRCLPPWFPHSGNAYLLHAYYLQHFLPFAFLAHHLQARRTLSTLLPPSPTHSPLLTSPPCTFHHTTPTPTAPFVTHALPLCCTTATFTTTFDPTLFHRHFHACALPILHPSFPSHYLLYLPFPYPPHLPHTPIPHLPHTHAFFPYQLPHIHLPSLHTCYTCLPPGTFGFCTLLHAQALSFLLPTFVDSSHGHIPTPHTSPYTRALPFAASGPAHARWATWPTTTLPHTQANTPGPFPTCPPPPPPPHLVGLFHHACLSAACGSLAIRCCSYKFLSCEEEGFFFLPAPPPPSCHLPTVPAYLINSVGSYIFLLKVPPTALLRMPRTGTPHAWWNASPFPTAHFICAFVEFQCAAHLHQHKRYFYCILHYAFFSRHTAPFWTLFCDTFNLYFPSLPWQLTTSHHSSTMLPSYHPYLPPIWDTSHMQLRDTDIFHHLITLHVDLGWCPFHYVFS